MFVGVVELHYHTHTTCCVMVMTECHNSHKPSQSYSSSLVKARSYMFASTDLEMISMFVSIDMYLQLCVYVNSYILNPCLYLTPWSKP